MICKPCTEVRHKACLGGSWCDCQHKASVLVLKAEGIDSGEAVGDIGAE